MTEKPERKFDQSKFGRAVTRTELWDIIYSQRQVMWDMLSAMQFLVNAHLQEASKALDEATTDMDRAKKEVDRLVYLDPGDSNAG